MQWSVSRVNAGNVTLVFRYANGGTTSRPLAVTVNGTSIGTSPARNRFMDHLGYGFDQHQPQSWEQHDPGQGQHHCWWGECGFTDDQHRQRLNNDDLSSGKRNAGRRDDRLHTNSGFTGSGYADFGSTNSSATFTVSASAAGATMLSLPLRKRRNHQSPAQRHGQWHDGWLGHVRPDRIGWTTWATAR